MRLGKTISGLIAGAALAVTTALMSGCENIIGDEEGGEEYVAPDTADVRGTWYDHGLSGGWFGPEHTWGFQWYYFKQYGTNIYGKTEYELYETSTDYDSLTDIEGTIVGNRISLIDYLGSSPYNTLEGTVNGNTIEGVQHCVQLGFDVPWDLEKTSTGIERGATPWHEQ